MAREGKWLDKWMARKDTGEGKLVDTSIESHCPLALLPPECQGHIYIYIYFFFFFLNALLL